MNEQGSVFPITLILVLIAMFIAAQAAIVYVSQNQFTYEIRQYYEREIQQKLKEGPNVNINESPGRETGKTEANQEEEAGHSSKNHPPGP